MTETQVQELEQFAHALETLAREHTAGLAMTLANRNLIAAALDAAGPGFFSVPRPELAELLRQNMARGHATLSPETLTGLAGAIRKRALAAGPRR